MVTATALRGQIFAAHQSRERAQSVPCSRQPGSGCQPQTAQLSRPVHPAVLSAGQWHRRQTPVQLTSHAALRHSRHTAAQAFNDDATDRQRSAQGSGSEAVARGGAGSTGSRLGELVNSPFDADIFSVAVPALASIMLDAIMLLVDTAIIGRLGTAPLGAVGLSTLIFVFSNLFFNFLTVCTTSSVANAAAEKDTAEVSKATARAMFVGLICGTALVFALWTYSPLLMTLLGTTPETATLAVMYLRVRCFACPAFLLYNVGTGNFRGRKDTRTPLLAYMANNITYVLLELLFVFGLKWGVVGAALAPAIGQYVGLAVMVGLLVREKALFAGDLGHVPTLEEVSPLLKKGLPLGAVNLLVLPVVVGCTSLVTALGVTSLAAHTIIKQVWDFWTQVSQCLNIAANSMVASALGEKDLSTARDVLLRILMMGFAPGVALGAAFLVAQSAIPAVFTQDPGVISAVTHIVPLLALAMPLIPVATVLEGALLGAVDTSYIAKRTGLGIAIALAVIYGSQSVLHMGLLGIWAGLASFLTSNTVCDTLRLMSPNSPLPVAIVPGIPDPTLNPEDFE